MNAIWNMKHINIVLFACIISLACGCEMVPGRDKYIFLSFSKLVAILTIIDLSGDLKKDYVSNKCWEVAIKEKNFIGENGVTVTKREAQKIKKDSCIGLQLPLVEGNIYGLFNKEIQIHFKGIGFLSCENIQQKFKYLINSGARDLLVERREEIIQIVEEKMIENITMIKKKYKYEISCSR